MGAGSNASALIRFLEQLARIESALVPNRFRVLLGKTAHLFECCDNQGDGGQLGLGVADLVFVDGECLTHEFVRDRFEIVEPNLADGDGSLEKESERELGELRF